MAPDGRSFVTAVGVSNVSVWVHTASGERQISLEGNAADPKFSVDGRKLCYRIVKEAPSDFQFTKEPGEVWVAEVDSGRSEPLVPGFQALDYDISGDGKQVVMEAEDAQGKPRLWLASFERQSPPRQIPNVEGRTPRFGPTGEIFFRSSGSVYRVRQDGTGMRKAIEQEILMNVSPDGRWILAWARLAGGGTAVQAFPLDGRASGPYLGPREGVNWSPDGRFWSLPGGLIGFIPEGRSYLIPLPPGGPCRRFRRADFIPSRKWLACRECAGSRKWGWRRSVSGRLRVLSWHHPAESVPDPDSVSLAAGTR